MKRVKILIWVLGLVVLLLLAHFEGFDNGSAYIQFVDGAVLAYGAGEYIEKRAHIKKFIETHRRLHNRIEQLHEKLDKHLENRGD